MQQADAEQAYNQSKLGGDTPTWVRLPAERRPESWNKFRDPVCPLVLALYGHPDSGGYWERHCHDHLTKNGFKEITAWRSCYMYEKLKLFLVVYVDNFKLAGPEKNLDKGWHLIRQRSHRRPHSVGEILRVHACRDQPLRGYVVSSVRFVPVARAHPGTARVRRIPRFRAGGWC